MPEEIINEGDHVERLYHDTRMIPYDPEIQPDPLIGDQHV